MSDYDDDGFKTAGGTNGETWDKDNGPIIGEYVGVKHNVGQNSSELYQIQEDGKEAPTGVWGGTVLDGRFEEVPLHSIVKISYLGKVKSKNGVGSYNDFEVKYKEPAGEPVEGEDLTAAQDALSDPKDV